MFPEHLPYSDIQAYRDTICSQSLGACSFVAIRSFLSIVSLPRPHPILSPSDNALICKLIDKHDQFVACAFYRAFLIER